MSEESGIKFYTLEDVKVHNGKGKGDSSVWIIYRDCVYDVTDYLEDHPGGGDLIMEHAGKNCTRAFDDFGHSSDAKRKLKEFKIGEIVEEQRKGAKKKTITVKTDPAEKPHQRSCFSIISCGFCG
ncbi:unnamed protein product [Ceutorhynchus assimilis]|uniref:Cytochrome b5 n=1 Tax=Ceutorhynchus assimilis TaxID=467358 RepID=A0A9N9MNU5_9CUCU|nr:unnamed protein product [Ceutorhynchus assimilis]